jgi:tetratricopeptide (TPR) repeat protein
MNLKRFNKAKSILMEVNQRKQISEAYYLLAKIARIEEDWDRAELAAQKATVLEATKSQYHLLFSQILKHLKKLERAEKEADLAIRYSAKPYPWLFDNRAWIRWMQKKHLMAARDWKTAIKLSSKRASYYTRAAECYVILGDFPTALDYYKKAKALDPENKHYKRRYREIESYKPGPDKPELN